METKPKKERRVRLGVRLGAIVTAAFLPLWAVSAAADDGARGGTLEILPAQWQAWLDRWWLDPELEWDDEAGPGPDYSLDAEIGHMITERLGLWSRPALRTDGDEQVEGWGLRFGIRYRLN